MRFFPATLLLAFLLALAAAASATRVVFVSPVRATFLGGESNHVEDLGNITAGDTITFLAELNSASGGEPASQWTALSAEPAFMPSGWNAFPFQFTGGRLSLTLNSSPLVSGLFLVKLRASSDSIAQTVAFRVNVKPAPAPAASAQQPGQGAMPENYDLMVYLLVGAVLLFVFGAIAALVMRRRKPRSYAERAKARRKGQQQSIFEMMKGGEAGAEGSAIKTTKRGLPFFKPRETKFETLEGVEKRMSAAAKVPVQVPKEEKKIDYKSKSTEDLVDEIDSALRELKPKRDWKLKEEKEK